MKLFMLIVMISGLAAINDHLERIEKKLEAINGAQASHQTSVTREWLAGPSGH
jgi:hypothetical protein